MTNFLFVSHNPFIISGYAIQLKMIIEKLWEFNPEYNIMVLACNFEGIQTNVDKPISIKDYISYRNNQNQNKNNNDNLEYDKDSDIYNKLKIHFLNPMVQTEYWKTIHQICIHSNIDKLICYMDIWCYEKYDISKIDCKKYIWLPVHNNFLPNPLVSNDSKIGITEVRNLWHLPYFDKIATFSTFGMRVLEEYGYNPTFINHAINSKDFYFTDNKYELRNKYGIEKNSFICLMIARNSEAFDRKGFLPQMTAFANFSKNKPNCKLMILENSTYSLEKGCLNLKKIAIDLNILSKIILINDSIHKTHHIRELYNLSDVLLCASRSEGFGIPMVEAQFCNLKVITNKCTSMPANTYFGVCVEPRQISNIIRGENSWSIPCETGISEVLNDFYNNTLDKYNIQMIDKNKYNIDFIFESWKKFLDL
jgi:hypothetical protein